MEAKDTVMTRLWMGDKKGIVTATTKLLEQQAEISFKIGKTVGVAESLQPALKAIDKSYKAGKREVVEWGNEPCTEHHIHSPKDWTPKHLCWQCWQAQKKEWGIDNETN